MHLNIDIPTTIQYWYYINISNFKYFIIRIETLYTLRVGPSLLFAVMNTKIVVDFMFLYFMQETLPCPDRSP